jgi:stage II sporulation protein AA (anti-sigma F factor antagonist)
VGTQTELKAPATEEGRLEVQTRKEENAVVVALGGRLDAVTSPDFEKRMRELIDGGNAALVVDFERLDYISSAGLRALLVIAKTLKAKDGRLRFANVKGGVHAVFDMSGFASMFPLDDSVAAALAALKKSP